MPWSRGPKLPLGATQETATVAVDGKVYVLGGFNGLRGVVGAVQVFDLETCTWSLGPELGPLHHANAAVVGDTIYVLGGLTDDSFTPLDGAWALTPARDHAWRPLPPMPAARGSAAVGVIDGRIYLAGGLAGQAQAALSVFDPSTGAWREDLPPLPAPRDHACGAAIGGRLYVVGGRQTQVSSVARTVFEYEPGGTWRTLAAMPTARGGVACGVVGERLIVVGGEGNPESPTGVFAQVESYDPAADRWDSLPTMPTPRHGMGAAAVDGTLVVPGGATRAGFAASAALELLTP